MPEHQRGAGEREQPRYSLTPRASEADAAVASSDAPIHVSCNDSAFESVE